MIKVEKLEKTFVIRQGKVNAVRGVSFSIDGGQFFTLLGPSGCGKTTVLRCLAGLERPEAGEIEISGKTVYSQVKRVFVPPNKRELGMVFQSYAVWPHMTVYENVAYPLRVRKVREMEVKSRAGRTLELVGLSSLMNRSVSQLSGGQQQRVALARAIVSEPQVLLLDEPLSNLDAKLREQMRAELRELQQAFGITTVYVTHDQEEALALSDRIAVMESGIIVEVGDPWTLYVDPVSPVTAKFIGLSNRFPGVVRETSGTMAEVQTGIGIVRVKRRRDLTGGASVTVIIRPESFSILLDEAGRGTINGQLVISGRIENMQFLGGVADYWVAAGGTKIRVRSHPKASLRRGDSVHLTLDPQDCIVLPAEGEGDSATRQ